MSSYANPVNPRRRRRKTGDDAAQTQSQQQASIDAGVLASLEAIEANAEDALDRAAKPKSNLKSKRQRQPRPRSRSTKRRPSLQRSKPVKSPKRKRGAPARPRLSRKTDSGSGSGSESGSGSDADSGSRTKRSPDVSTLMPLLVAQAMDAQKTEAETKAAIAALDAAPPRYILPNNPAVGTAAASASTSASAPTPTPTYVPIPSDALAEADTTTFLEPLPGADIDTSAGFRLFAQREGSNDEIAQLLSPPFKNSVRGLQKLFYTFQGEGNGDNMRLKIVASATTHVHSGAYHKETLRRKEWIHNQPKFKPNQQLDLPSTVASFLNGAKMDAQKEWTLHLAWLDGKGREASREMGSSSDFYLTKSELKDICNAMLGIARPPGTSSIDDEVVAASAAAATTSTAATAPAAAASAAAAKSGSSTAAASAAPTVAVAAKDSELALRRCDVVVVAMDPVAPLPELTLTYVEKHTKWTLQPQLSADRAKMYYFFPLELYGRARFTCEVDIRFKSGAEDTAESITSKHTFSNDVLRRDSGHLLTSEEERDNDLVPLPYMTENLHSMPIYSFEVQVERAAVLQYGEFPQLHWREHESKETTRILRRANTDGVFMGSLTRHIAYKMWYAYPRHGKKSSEVLIMPKT